MFVGETEQEVRKRLVNVSGRPMSVGLCFTVAHEQFGIFHKTCYRNLVILCQESCRPPKLISWEMLFYHCTVHWEMFHRA